MPKSPGELYRERIDALEKQTGHTLVHTGVGMSDQWTCSCGWKSIGYWDGPEWCAQEYEAHLNKILNPPEVPPKRSAEELVRDLRARADILGGQPWERTATQEMMREAADMIEKLSK